MTTAQIVLLVLSVVALLAIFVRAAVLVWRDDPIGRTGYQPPRSRHDDRFAPLVYR